jgi:hypothetical protein
LSPIETLEAIARKKTRFGQNRPEIREADRGTWILLKSLLVNLLNIDSECHFTTGQLLLHAVECYGRPAFCRSALHYYVPVETPE